MAAKSRSRSNGLGRTMVNRPASGSGKAAVISRIRSGGVPMLGADDGEAFVGERLVQQFEQAGIVLHEQNAGRTRVHRRSPADVGSLQRDAPLLPMGKQTACQRTLI